MATEKEAAMDWGKWLIVMLFPILISGFVYTNSVRLAAIEEKLDKQDEADRKLLQHFNDINIIIAKLDSKPPTAEEWRWIKDTLNYYINQRGNPPSRPSPGGP